MPVETTLSPAALAAAGLIIGLLVGSFLNVVILRLPKQLQDSWKKEASDFLGLQPEPVKESVTIAKPASRCPACGAPIKAWHNIPVFSYLFLKGKCSACSTPISIQYPLVELTSGLATAFILYHFGITAIALYSVVFTWCLIALTGIDFHEQLLPDQITLPLLWLGLFANLSGVFVPLNEAVIGAIGGYLCLWSIYWLFKLVTGKEGMGYGDFKLLAALGAWMGWQMLPLIIILSSFVGAIVGIINIILKRQDKDVPMAFGPFLAIAGWIALVWGDQIVHNYLTLFAQ